MKKIGSAAANDWTFSPRGNRLFLLGANDRGRRIAYRAATGELRLFFHLGTPRAPRKSPFPAG